TAGEQSRTVGAWQKANFRNDCADGRQIAAIDTVAGVENVPANDLRLQVLENGRKLFSREFWLFNAFREEVSLRLGLCSINSCVTSLLFGDLVSVAQIVFDNCEHLGFEVRQIFRLEITWFLGSNFSELDDRVDNWLE